MTTRFAFAVAVALLVTAPVIAADHSEGNKLNMAGPMIDKNQDENVMIKDPWARASIGRTGGAYFTMVNSGHTDIKLVGVSADVANRVELHTHIMDGNIMRMRPLKSIVVPAGTSIILKPGGHHVMLMGLTQKLEEGDAFALTIIFEKAGKKQVSVRIGKIWAAGPTGDMKHMDGQSGHKMKH